MGNFIEEIRQDLVRAIEDDRLTLPTLPEAALRVREVVKDKHCNAVVLAGVLEHDAALSAMLIKYVNSPLVRGQAVIHDLRHAVGRLGVEVAGNIVVSFALKRMFRAKNPAVQLLMREIWSQSSRVAAISHALCRHFTPLSPDRATIAGVVHRIGALPILTYVEQQELLVDEDGLLEALIDALAPRLGQDILRAWEFPPDLSHVPVAYLDTLRQREQVDYTDIVTVAAILNAPDTASLLSAQAPTQISAFERVGFPYGGKLADHEQIEIEVQDSMRTFG